MSKISKILNLPTQFFDVQIDEKAESHPNFKGYDHSLEKVRIKFKTIGDGGGDGIEMGDLTSADILNKN